jgi:hypothetical protein
MFQARSRVDWGHVVSTFLSPQRSGGFSLEVVIGMVRLPPPRFGVMHRPFVA